MRLRLAAVALCVAALALVAVSQGVHRRSALEGVAAKDCIELAQRAKSHGLAAGDKQLAVRCLHLAKGAEKRARGGAAPAGAARRKAVLAETKEEVPLTVDHKKMKVQLYRPHGFHAKLAHPKRGAQAAAQAREFGAVDPQFIVQQRGPWWKRAATASGAAPSSYLTYDNMPASIRQHLAKNNMPWWKKDAHYGYNAKEHKGAKVIGAKAQ